MLSLPSVLCDCIITKLKCLVMRHLSFCANKHVWDTNGSSGQTLHRVISALIAEYKLKAELVANHGAKGMTKNRGDREDLNVDIKPSHALIIVNQFTRGREGHEETVALGHPHHPWPISESIECWISTENSQEMQFDISGPSHRSKKTSKHQNLSSAVPLLRLSRKRKKLFSLMKSWLYTNEIIWSIAIGFERSLLLRCISIISVPETAFHAQVDLRR